MTSQQQAKTLNVPTFIAMDYLGERDSNAKVLAGESEFTGAIVRGENAIDCIVHPFYQQKGEGCPSFNTIHAG